MCSQKMGIVVPCKSKSPKHIVADFDKGYKNVKLKAVPCLPQKGMQPKRCIPFEEKEKLMKAFKKFYSAFELVMKR